MKENQILFNGLRSQMYKQALNDYPDARESDIYVMKKYLAPQSHEVILEAGAGSGFFSGILADMLPAGKLIVSDPSDDQLNGVKGLKKENIEVLQEGADHISLPEEKVDAVWSFGALHHCFDKTKAFGNFSRILKKNGRLVIGDVWSSTKLADYFDRHVAKHCVTGHEVAFWSDGFTETLCAISGFSNPEIYDLPLQWKFKKEEEIGDFIYKFHAMISTTPEDCLNAAHELLGIQKQEDGTFNLNWPMKIFVATKL
ncbi:class I SAM-dependent methyltransferase [Chryseobacterium sp. BIGb0232]|uniref:class I SAM-dependent methyltransferase n=1 Tax=Chryseobacterium sp. BIGb0232 TaxID=2940598 RepID=UPI000F4902F0|nr:class I SAM-dependent methyltransferase [Chryseobacterium sp. BIGb0232]MCS4302601.1 SAM-dependent methyltransferase [Chryseobacterium sp. BIGb0232]ROS17255.1 methyltransferase family protein [Chryseobacterium nakagawai]